MENKRDLYKRELETKKVENNKVFGAIGGLVDYHEFTKFKVSGDKTLGDFISDILVENKELKENINKLKESIILISKEIEKIKKDGGF